MTQATIRPKTALTAAAANAVPKLTRNAARTRGEPSDCQASAPAPAALSTRAPSGISTTSPR